MILTKTHVNYHNINKAKHSTVADKNGQIHDELQKDHDNEAFNYDDAQESDSFFSNRS
jgi:hypothetical protein